MPDRGEGEEGEVDLANTTARRGDEEGGETEEEERSEPLRERRDMYCSRSGKTQCLSLHSLGHGGGQWYCQRQATEQWPPTIAIQCCV